MDLFASGEVSIQDMIEGDLQGVHAETGTIPTPMFTVSLPVEVSLGDLTGHLTNDNVSALLSKAHNWDTNTSLDIRTTINNGTVNLSGVQAQLIINAANGNPNLLVNPTTGLPVQHPQYTVTTIDNMDHDRSESESVLQNNDVHLMSSKPNIQFVSTCDVVNSTQSKQQQHFTHQTLAKTLLSTQSVSQQPLQSIQNNNMPYHQTLTHHLLSNSNARKLQKDSAEKVWPKPVYSYSCLIAMALKNSETGALPVSEIYSFMTEHFPYFKTAPDGWKNSVRHNLSLNKCFEKIENPRATGNTRKGCLWGLNPHKIEKMEDEIVKWRKKDPPAVNRSMSNPDKLEEIERGTIGSHAPLPPEYLKALREAQLMRLNNMHANPTLNSPLINGGSIPTVVSSGVTKPTLTMVTPVYVSDKRGLCSGTLTLQGSQRTPTQLLTSQISNNKPEQHVMHSKSNGSVQVTMVEVVPANKIQQIKCEPSDHPADIKPIVINLPHTKPTEIVKPEVVKREKTLKAEAEENMVLDNNLFFCNTEHPLSDLGLQNSMWDDLTNEGIDFSDIPTGALNLSFSTTPSPAGVKNVSVLAPQKNGTKSPLIGLLQSRTISART